MRVCGETVSRGRGVWTPTVFERSYAKVFDDRQDMEETWRRLAAIGFGVSGVDQALTNGF